MFTSPPQSSAAAASSAASSQVCEVVVPFDVKPGSVVVVQVPDGRKMHVKVSECMATAAAADSSETCARSLPTRSLASACKLLCLHCRKFSSDPYRVRPRRRGHRLIRVRERSLARRCGLRVTVSTGRRRSGLIDRAVSAVTSAVEYIQQQATFSGGVKNRIGHALYQRLRRAIQNQERFRVLVVMPLHPNGRFLDSVECKAVMQQQVHARASCGPLRVSAGDSSPPQFETICRGEKSLLARLRLEFPTANLDDYILFTSLRAHGHMLAGPVSEQVYVHSKLLIVDDRLVIIGSSNLNDRSMCGDRDSEIAVVVKDRTFYRTQVHQHTAKFAQED
jgi:phosphatidylserine/phosphatidylglycerophosphate/cardiolipin synthase-like enzyme